MAERLRAGDLAWLERRAFLQRKAVVDPLLCCLSGRKYHQEVILMPKAELTTIVTPKCQALADEQGYELVDVSLDKEGADKYLRIYIDKPEGITLNDCERYHRAIQPQLESYDYDFLEVSSPGVDRPLKKDRDFERAIGTEVEVHLFKAMDGSKLITGFLQDYSKEEILLDTPAGQVRLSRKACALVKPVVDMEGVESVDLSE